MRNRYAPALFLIALLVGCGSDDSEDIGLPDPSSGSAQRR